MIEVIRSKIRLAAARDLLFKHRSNCGLPWWAISKASQLVDPLSFPKYKQVFSGFCHANKGKPVIDSRQDLVSKLVIDEDGAAWFSPTSLYLTRTCAAGFREDDPHYDPNAVRGHADVGGKRIYPSGSNLSFKYRTEKSSVAAHAEIDLSVVSIEEFEEFFESSQFIHPTFDIDEFNKKYIDLLNRCCSIKLSLPTKPEGGLNGNEILGQCANRLEIRHRETGHISVGDHFREGVVAKGQVFGVEDGLFRKLIVTDLKLRLSSDESIYVECGVRDYLEHIPDLEELKAMIESQADIALVVDALFKLRVAGIKQTELSLFVNEISHSNDSDSDYADSIDDLVSALEGHCCKTYILHPSNY